MKPSHYMHKSSDTFLSFLENNIYLPTLSTAFSSTTAFSKATKANCSSGRALSIERSTVLSAYKWRLQFLTDKPILFSKDSKIVHGPKLTLGGHL